MDVWNVASVNVRNADKRERECRDQLDSATLAHIDKRRKVGEKRCEIAKLHQVLASLLDIGGNMQVACESLVVNYQFGHICVYRRENSVDKTCQRTLEICKKRKRAMIIPVHYPAGRLP